MSNQNLRSNSKRNTVYQYDNPYYLHHNDHARLALVTDRLNTASEFLFWRRSVRMGLNVRTSLDSLMELFLNRRLHIEIMALGPVVTIW